MNGDSMSYAEFQVAFWRIWRDLVHRFGPYMNSAGLLLAISDCRDEPGALWEGLNGPLAVERDLLRYSLCDAYEGSTGRPWPIASDRVQVPDDVRELTA
jgi:hypothetical protein